MDWFNFFTGKIAFGSIAGIAIAAVITCWRAGSFYPVNARLLRFFISKDEIEDPDIRQNLADQAALVSFRMTHGVRSRTIIDAKRLALFSKEKNLPLDLIGKAGWVFDLKKLEINPKRIPHGGWPVGAAILLFFFIFAMIISAAIASVDDLLITIKGTDTSLWLSKDEARKVRPFFGARSRFSKDDCLEIKNIDTPAGFHPGDTKILCDIWKNPSLGKSLEKEIHTQHWAFWWAFVMCALYALMIFRVMNQWLSQIELNKMILLDKMQEKT
ncbi:hypothetical protein XACN24_12770 [Xanthomonas albilineans]|uniref:Transmembrane protein n=1 Tax=Xanthomonas albilineans (strain GPE PC73 / CFBP 7063) TaxID=380358 RepID=D2UFC6_XANAP|nr:DUF6216 family protein [Xanthomonas albilineans]CBA17087.1 hypothetical protein XALC_2609 [Xanthomonas albilineans GPE PC73]